MANDDLSTEGYAALIADSKLNGQHQQAIKQFRRALKDHVNVLALAQDMQDNGMNAQQVINLLCGFIDSK